MKIAILGDMHWGARNDSQFFLDQFSRFVDSVLVPACVENGVKEIIQLGDLMDRRKFVNFLTLRTVKQNFFGRLAREGISVSVLLGNHDVFYKDTNELNSLSMLFQGIPNARVIEEPTEHLSKICVVPWICPENKERVMDLISKTQASYLMGHFEFAGFDMYRGVPCEHGEDHTAFSRFRKVYSGHFHTRSIRDNVEYVGTPYEIIWSDYGDQKGFLILDLDSGEETWIPNLSSVHRMIRYRESEIPKTYDFSIVTDRYVKVVVEEAENQKKLDAFVKMCYANSPVHLSVIDMREQFAGEEFSPELVADKDPLTALTDEIRKRNTEELAMSLIKKSNELYLEAMTEREVSA